MFKQKQSLHKTKNAFTRSLLWYCLFTVLLGLLHAFMIDTVVIYYSEEKMDYFLQYYTLAVGSLVFIETFLGKHKNHLLISFLSFLGTHIVCIFGLTFTDKIFQLTPFFNDHLIGSSEYGEYAETVILIYDLLSYYLGYLIGVLFSSMIRILIYFKKE